MLKTVSNILSVGGGIDSSEQENANNSVARVYHFNRVSNGSYNTA